MLYEKITSDIIAAFYTVYNTLGYGFLEKVYENAFAVEIAKHNHDIKQQVQIEVFYEGQAVGNYFADMLVDDKVVIEFKVAEAIVKGHEAQLVNYLKATKIEVGLLLNFGPKPEFKRKIFSNQKKSIKNPREFVLSA